MEELISTLVTEVVIYPIIFIMMTGMLVVPFLTPVMCCSYILGVFLGKIPAKGAWLSLLLSTFGLVVTVGVWFLNPMTESVGRIVDNPLETLLVPILVLVVAIREQRRLDLTEMWEVVSYVGLFLAATALYWMALAAAMSASV